MSPRPGSASSSPAEDKLLFTPGPLTTSATVKQAMLHDLGSRDPAFLAVVGEVRDRLLALAGTSRAAGFEAIPMQGSGTFAIEAVISSVLPRDARLLVAVNGAYGRRIAAIARVHGVETRVVEFPEAEPVDPRAVDREMADGGCTALAAVHCETTSGVMNPAGELGGVARRRSSLYVLDSMSAFGAVPFDMEEAGVDFLVSSANKAIGGVPGFAFVLVRRAALEASRGHARTVSLDLIEQWDGLERNGQFRFTPPTHALLAFRQALDELDAEGGIEARGRRLRALQERLREGMTALGLREYVAREHQGPVITTFHYPRDPAFDFEAFYRALADRGCLIYPGKVTDAECFRIGSIGHLALVDVEKLLEAVAEALRELGVERF